MFQHSHILELVFLGMANIGILVCVWGIATTAKDSKIINIQRRNSAMHVTTMNRLFQESFRLGMHAVMVLLSWIFVYTAPPPPDYSEITQSLAGILGWIIVDFLLLCKEFLDRRERMKLDALYDKVYGLQNKTPNPGRRAYDVLMPPDDSVD